MLAKPIVKHKAIMKTDETMIASYRRWSLSTRTKRKQAQSTGIEQVVSFDFPSDPGNQKPSDETVDQPSA